MRAPPETLDVLRTHGIKATPQRLAILEYIQNAQGHPRADEVFRHVRQLFPGMSKATVYNTLNTLVEKELLLQVPSTGGYCRFEARLEHHYHVVCQQCGRIEDYPAAAEVADLHARVEEHTGFLVRGHRLDFMGLCPDCRTKPAPAFSQARSAGD